METEVSALADRITSFEFDARDTADPFSKRLARENRWSPEYTARVLVEYKRFLLLASTADHPVTPSDQVDQAWHLHLLYSAEYRSFCRNVLGRTLDHGPSSGGAQQRSHFVHAYQQTLLSYPTLFGEAPPPDIWPDAESRFGHDLAFVRLNREDFWTLRKPEAWRWSAKRITPVVSLRKLSFVCLGLIGVGSAGVLAAWLPISGAEFLGIHIVMWAATLVTAGVIRARRSASASPATPSSVPDLDPYEVAYLGGGSRMALDSALTALIARGTLVFDRDKRTLHVGSSLQADAPQLEQHVYAELLRAPSTDVPAFRRRASELTVAISSRLQQRGLMTKHRYDTPFWIALIAPVVGGARAVAGLSNDKPVFFLVLLCIAGGVVAFKFFRSRSERTRFGETVLETLKQRHESLRPETAGGAPAVDGTLPIALGLFGLSVLVDSNLAEWSDTLSDADGGEGGCSGADGDGGGGCSGGGCGGCGGGCG
jgi:uncharacterized protein (TIGR04222 family)